MRKRIRLFRQVSPLVLLGVVACDSSLTEPKTELGFSTPQEQRQSDVFRNSTMRAYVVVNNGSVQLFEFSPEQASFRVEVTGIRLNENNDIQITWAELLNGFEVEVSRQSQSFFAAGNVRIEAPHQTDQYDYDSDGVANIDERINGTCVWSADDACLQEGQLDIPVSITQPAGVNDTNEFPGLSELEQILDLAIPQPFVFDYANSSNVLQNREIDSWYTFDATLTEQDGVVCVNFPSSPITQFLLLLSGPDVIMEPARYSAEFDIMTSRETVVNWTLPEVSAGTFIPIIEQYVYSSREWRTIRIPFEYTSDIVQVEYGFAALTNELETTYCLRNFRLFKEGTQ